jgi:DNA-directed RNA polymerase subunit N (RpoN/RPB10)
MQPPVLFFPPPVLRVVLHFWSIFAVQEGILEISICPAHLWKTLPFLCYYSMGMIGIQWNDYCQQVERSIRGDDEEPATEVSVFGVCRRCGSRRLLVTTRQLRRADEGMSRGIMRFMMLLRMTELRQCRECGHVTKINS